MKKVLSTIGILVLVISMLVSAGPVLGQEVSTSANVDAAGSEPIIKAKWECAANDDPDRPGIQIFPNPAGPMPGEGGETEVCVYAVVTDPNGIGDITGVYFKVFHPDGTEKLQVHMVKVEDPAEIEWAKMDAVDTGQLTLEQAAELDEEIDKNDAEMWVGCWIYEIHQPAGEYCIEVSGVDQFGNITKMMNCIYIESIVVLALDFSSVNFGAIVPRAEKWVMGNDVFDPGDGRPTVWNQGNDLASLMVHSDPMVGVAEGKEITTFDVQLLEEEVVYEACDWVCLTGPLEPCTPTQIDFSIHPPEFLPMDVYEGAMHFEIVYF